MPEGLRTKAVAVLRRSPPVWRALRAVRQRLNQVLPPRRIEGVIGPVHRNDTMLRATGRHRYHDTAVETIELFTDRATARGVDPSRATWFEIGCGYGRLVRILADRVDPKRITVCDIDPDASRFCEKTFGVRRSLSDASFRFTPPVRADVVYALSVATHLPAAGFRNFLVRSIDSVEDGGVLLFSTHGTVALGQLHVYAEGAFAPYAEEIRAGYEGPEGFAYEPYGHDREASYGMAWHRADLVPAAIASAAAEVGATVEVDHEESRIEGHQDLWICRVSRRS